MNNIMAQFRQFMQNPRQYMQLMGIPINQIQTPNDVIDYLMRSGKVSQQDYNKAAQVANRLKNNM